MVVFALIGGAVLIGVAYTAGRSAGRNINSLEQTEDITASEESGSGDDAAAMDTADDPSDAR